MKEPEAQTEALALAQTEAEKIVQEALEPKVEPEPEPKPKVEPKVEPEIPNMIQLARETVTALTEQNIRMEKNIAEQHKLRVEAIMGGTAKASQPTQTDNERSIDEARKLLAGTGYEDIPLQ